MQAESSEMLRLGVVLMISGIARPFPVIRKADHTALFRRNVRWSLSGRLYGVGNIHRFYFALDEW